jgi:hypothetical protein
VIVNKDGSAHVNISDWTEYEGEKLEESLNGEEMYSDFDSFENSVLITNYSRTEEDKFYTVKYDIKNVDSLGSYLLPIPGDSVEMDNPIVFKYTKDKFTITQEFDESIQANEATMYGELIPFKAIFKFKKRIKNFNSNVDFVKQTDKKTIEVNANLNEISYGEGIHKVEVFF